MAEGDIFKFERFFLKIFEEGYLVCCDCEASPVNKFTRKGLVQHANSAHGRAVDVVNRAECNTKQLVIRETREMISQLSEHKKVCRSYSIIMLCICAHRVMGNNFFVWIDMFDL